MPTILRSCLLVLLLAAYRAPAQSLPGVNTAWEPITDAELQMSAPTIEKDAGAEALFWTVHVVDDFQGGQDPQRVLYHYVRLKVFDQKGKEQVSTIDIESGPKVSIANVAARTVKPDGTVVEMKSNTVYERDLVRASGRKKHVKSFALPAVEPGSIVEYRYKEIRWDTNILYMRLQLQKEYPVHKVTYYVKPLPQEYTGDFRMVEWPFNCTPSPLKLEHNGYSSFALENVPAFHEEPYMLADANVRPWVLLYYRSAGKRDPDKYWDGIGRKIYGDLKDSLKANNDIKRAANEVVSGANTPEEKVTALIRYLWKNTRGLYDTGVTDAERNKVLAKMPKDRKRTAAEVLKSGLGTADERNLLFAAMASSVGLEARPVLLPNQTDILFDPRMTDDYFLDNVDMAVKIGDDWKFYDVSAHLPPGMLVWSEEGLPSLLSDPKKPVFVRSPIATPESSLTKRTARMTLSENGTLEGDIEESFAGHAAPEKRSKLEGESEARQREIYKELVTAVFAEAEVTAIAFRNVDNAAEPLIVNYHIKVPAYAMRTAKRILLQPMFFERGAAPDAAQPRFRRRPFFANRARIDYRQAGLSGSGRRLRIRGRRTQAAGETGCRCVSGFGAHQAAAGLRHRRDARPGEANRPLWDVSSELEIRRRRPCVRAIHRNPRRAGAGRALRGPARILRQDRRQPGGSGGIDEKMRCRGRRIWRPCPDARTRFIDL